MRRCMQSRCTLADWVLLLCFNAAKKNRGVGLGDLEIPSSSCLANSTTLHTQRLVDDAALLFLVLFPPPLFHEEVPWMVAQILGTYPPTLAGRETARASVVAGEDERDRSDSAVNSRS